MNVPQVAFKLREQICCFLGNLRMAKPVGRFVLEALYAITARQSVMLVIPAMYFSMVFLDQPIRLRPTVLSHHALRAANPREADCSAFPTSGTTLSPTASEKSSSAATAAPSLY